MKKMFIMTALIFLCLLFLCNSTFADIYKDVDDEGVLRMTNVPDGKHNYTLILIENPIFSMPLPNGWVAIPRDKIDSMEKEVARTLPNAKEEHYDYAFQLESSKNWFEYPYILIQVKNTGRIPENQLEKMQGYSLNEKSLDKQKKALGSIMSDIQVGKMFYDKQNKIIWMRMESNVENIGPISAITGMIPTEKGFIQVNGYALKNNYLTYESIFQEVAKSISPEPALVYKPRWSDGLPTAVTGIDWGKIISKAIAGAITAAIIGGIIALIAAFRKKKKL